MPATVRFPYNRNIPNVGRNELTQIIQIRAPGAGGALPAGGDQAYADVRPWKIAGENTEAPYTCVVLEFSGSAAGTIGNGTTELIGLFGQIDLVTAPTVAVDRKRTLIAVVGINIGNTMPQIPLIQQAAAASDLVGFSQAFNNIAVYDRLSIGGVLGDVALPEGLNLTVVARPIRRRDYLG